MATTDRMSNLDSSRAGVDRTGGTVTFGNSIESEGVEIIAAASAGFGSESDAAVSMNMTASFTGNAVNGSFGIWAVDFDLDAAALLVGNGAAIGAAALSAIATALATWGADGMLLNIQVFTATGTYTPTSGTAQIVVHCLGAGGGGGGCAATSGNNAAASGGGAGGYGIARIASGFSGQTVTIGAGGAGGAAGDNDGTAGGATSFGTLLIAGGGSPGLGDTAGVVPRGQASGSGGSVSGSASLFGANGQDGSQGWADSTTLSHGGGGGSTLFGGGAHARISGAIGQPGTGFGSGGGGAALAGTASASSGGAGAPGLCIIYEYNA